ncbi:MAG: lipopolysaccharide biosynthesis protein [Rhizobiaceae bacterium]
MFQRLVPSQIIGPAVPQALRERHGERIAGLLDKADAVMAGRDETAVSQRTAVFVFTIRIVSALIAYVSQVLLARWLGGYEYGVFVWVWTAVIICGGLSCLGFPSAIVRFIPEYRLSGDLASLRGVIFGSRFYSTLAATSIAATGMLALWLFEDAVSSIYAMPFFLALICMPMLSLGDVQEGVARAFNWMNLALSPKFLIRPLLILVAMVIALALGWPPTALTALGASIAAVWLTTIGQMLLIDRRLSNTVETGSRQMHSRTWILISLPIFLVEGFYVLLTNVDILIAGFYLPADRVAIYFAAVKTLALVHFVYYAVRAASAHRYAHFFNAGDPKAYQNYVRNTVLWTFWPSVAMATVILILGKFLLALFGPEFTVGYPLLFVLVIGILARASVGPAESVLTMSGQQNLCAAIYGATLLVNILLNVSLIPLFGLYGAAWATTFAMIFEGLALYSIALRRLGLHMFIFAPAHNNATGKG